MSHPICAAIDIGTNSVLLTIAKCHPNGSITPIVEEAHITRIGEGLGASEQFCEAAMQRTQELLECYVARCHEHQVAQMIAVGTAAFRRATNSADFLRRVEVACGLQIRIISGQTEAQLAFHAAAHDFGDDLFVLDIGGGSTEFMWTMAETVQAHSFPIGSVILHEELCRSDPITDADLTAMRTRLRSSLDVVAPLVHKKPATLVALAGTATTLAAMQLQLRTYAHDQVHGTVLTAEQIHTIVDRLRRATLAQRKQMVGLEPARADVILSGALLLEETMHRFGYDRVTISDRGVRWGLLYEAFGQHASAHS